MAKLVSFLAVACVVLLCARHASAVESKMYYGDHEGPFDYSLLEADSRSDLPSRGPAAPVVVGQDAAFPFEVPKLPADFPNAQSNFEPISSRFRESNPYDSNEYARNQALLEERATTHMHPGFLGYSPAQQREAIEAVQHVPGTLYYDEFPMDRHSHYMIPVRAPAMHVTREHLQGLYQHDGRMTPIPVFIEAQSAAEVQQRADTDKTAGQRDYSMDDVGPPSSFPADATERIPDNDQDNSAEQDKSSAPKAKADLSLNGDSPVRGVDPATPRFAQTKTSAQASGSESQVTPIEPRSVPNAQGSGSSDAPMGSSPSSSSSMSDASSSMQSAADPASTEGLSADDSEPKKRYRCVTKDGVSCAVRFPGIDWKVNIVDKLEEPQSASGAPNSVTPTSSSLADTGLVTTYSENPDIAAAQKAYYAREQELIKEKNWVVQIQKVIREYQDKVRNVNAHISHEKVALQRTKQSIVRMIRRDKQQKLSSELRLAIDALRKLESTSKDLNSKIVDLKGTKSKLHATISRIQRSLGGALASSVRQTAGSLLEVGGEANPDALEVLKEAHSLNLDEEEKNNDHVKGLFASLLEMAAEHENHINEAHSHHQHKHELKHHHGHAHSSALHQIIARAHEDVEPKSPSLLEEGESRIDEDEDDRETRHAIKSHKSDVSLIQTGSLADRVNAISQKYAAEETERLHADIPLSDLAMKEAEEIDHDDTLQG